MSQIPEEDSVRLEYREKWDAHFLNYIKSLEKKKPAIVCGDLNVAHTEMDLANPKENYNKTAGFTQVEIDGMRRMLDAGYIDSFRKFNPEKVITPSGATCLARGRRISAGE